MSPVPIADSDVQASAQDDDYDLFEGFELSDSHDYLDEVEPDEIEENEPLSDFELDDDEDDEDAGDGDSATALLQRQLDLESSLLENDADLFSTGDPTRAIHSGDLTTGAADVDKTNMVNLPLSGGRGAWPTDDQLLPALNNSPQNLSLIHI